MQKRRVFVDSSVLIRGLLFEKTNSALILKMIRKKELTGVINRKVVYEVLDVLKQIKDKDFASLSFSFMHSTFEIVPEELYYEEMEKLRGQIKEKDLEHLAAASSQGIVIIAFDRDFDKVKNYFTPKKFLESMSMKTYDTEY
ncbi:MAG: PIN domain-containing protein [Candidatus Methanoperedens sp.]|nr:PIN domain-containing protein [Candidatus Methanoperedens sp.]